MERIMMTTMESGMDRKKWKTQKHALEDEMTDQAMNKDSEGNSRDEVRKRKGELNNGKRRERVEHREKVRKEKRDNFKERRMKVLFWNVAGINQKEESFWEYIRTFDVVGMMETWVEEKDWSRTEKRLPEGFRWKSQAAVREKRKGRAKGGIITGVRQEIEEVIEQNSDTPNFVKRNLKIGQRIWKIATIYSTNMRNTKKEIEQKINETREERIMIGGDFNARVGEGGKRYQEQERETRRPAKDKEDNNNGKIMLELIEDRGWEMLNGNKDGDEKGEFTYIRGNVATTIDYALANEDAYNEIVTFRIGNRVESDHLPLEIEIETEEELQREEKSRNKIHIQRRNWNEEDIWRYRQGMKMAKFEAETVEEKIEELTRYIDQNAQKKTKTGWKRRNNWWNAECTEKKKEARKRLKEWKNDKGTRQEYIEARGEYRKKCRERKEEVKKEEEIKIRRIHKESDVWKYINRNRKEKERTSDRIQKHEWREHFMKLLEGENEVRDDGEAGEEDESEDDRIEKDEMMRQIQRLKKGKAPGKDEIENEAWIYGTDEMMERLLEILNDVWNGRGFPRKWREGIICPVHKKGNRHAVENYRGITLLNTAYKIYAMIMEERLTKEMEERGVLPDGQAGFRKGRGTVDNIYILQYIVERELNKKGGHVYALFVDIKAAFDNVDRGKLWRCLRERGISEYLVRRMEEAYKETSNRVRVNGEEGERFYTKKGVRQGCPLSPKLFTAYIAEMEDMFRRAQAGGIVVGKEKVWSLAYADDLVIIAKDEKNMKEMMKNLEKFMKRKKLQLNVQKTKVMVFGKGRSRQTEWRWEQERIEEVREIKYLGYVFTRTNNNNANMKENTRKANKILGIVWGIGERLFRHDIGRRLTMFDCLIRSVIMYAAEIWGWKEYVEIERIQEKYIRWIIGLERETPGYIVREEVKGWKLKIEAGRRAVKYEERMRDREECKILLECWRERNKKKEGGIWNDREQYYKRNGYASEEVERIRGSGYVLTEELKMRDRDVEMQERLERIRESRYHRNYEKLMTKERPKYLERENAKERRMVARFRCGNEEKGNKFWLEENERRCRLCGDEEETMEHMMRTCTEVREIEERVEDILDEDGRGLEWMKMIMKSRTKFEF